jgi:cation:H+ antiporter
MLVYASLAAIFGFLGVAWGADRFVFGAAGLARNLGVSTLVIGLTIVAFGTSAPEMLVSGVAAWEDLPAMGIGNAVGSNITNVTLVLGSAAVARPLRVASRLLRRELPILLSIMFVTYSFLANGVLSRLEGIALLLGMAVLVGWIIYLGLHEAPNDPDPLTHGLEEIPELLPSGRATLWAVIGLLTLLAGSRLLVWGAQELALSIGVSDLVIGLTVVAFGTSLPELAASVAAARRNEDDIAIGNVVGSNMFNLLGVLGLPGVIAPGPIDPEVLSRDFPVMIGVTLLLVLMSRGDRQHHIGLSQGMLLLVLYFGYTTLVFLRG